MCTLRKKPMIVPALDLENLPEYETSSEEEDAAEDETELPSHPQVVAAAPVNMNK